MSTLGVKVVVALAAFSTSVHAATPNAGNQNDATKLYLEKLNRDLSLAYLYGVLIVTLGVSIYRISFRLHNHIRHLTCLTENPGAQRYFASAAPWSQWIKRHLLFAPLLHHKRATEIKFSKSFNFGTIPTRAQTLFIGFILLYNVFASIYNIPWSSPTLQVLPIVRSRTGTLSVVNMVPIVVMSTIKNPLINLLDISYDSFLLMHRWLARMAILQAIAHTGAHIAYKANAGGIVSVYQTAVAVPFIGTGAMATLAFIAIALHSPKLFRLWAYEVFVHVHIALVAVGFGFLWHHLEEYYQRRMLLAAMVIWGASRLWRWTTMFYRSLGRGGCKAVIEALPSDAVRIEFRTPRPWNFKAGQTLYLTIPSIGFWTSHPFSVAWSDFVHEDGTKVELQRSASTRTVVGEKKPTNFAPCEEVTAELKGKQTFSIIVKKKGGFTSKLYDAVAKQQGKPLIKTALIEGPYGHAKSLASYGTVCLFASGVGITHQMPYVRDLVDGYAQGSVATRRVTLVWVVPDTGCLEWVRPWMHEILAMDRRREVLKIFLYISKATLSHEIRSPSETVRMSRGRPDVMSIVRRECQEGIGCVGISVCAGGGLGDEVRRAARFMIGHGYSVDFVEEFFGW